MHLGQLALGVLLALIGAVLVAPVILMWVVPMFIGGSTSLVAVAPELVAPILVALFVIGPLLLIFGVRLALAAREEG